jgi:hypothetical protein
VLNVDESAKRSACCLPLAMIAELESVREKDICVSTALCWHILQPDEQYYYRIGDRKHDQVYVHWNVPEFLSCKDKHHK